jgi:hypothetical protein
LVAVISKPLVVFEDTGPKPDITPVEEFKVAPVGRLPLVTLYETDAAPGPGLA